MRLEFVPERTFRTNVMDVSEKDMEDIVKFMEYGLNMNTSEQRREVPKMVCQRFRQEQLKKE
jgi:hypothetical protein